MSAIRVVLGVFNCTKRESNYACWVCVEMCQVMTGTSWFVETDVYEVLCVGNIFDVGC